MINSIVYDYIKCLSSDFMVQIISDFDNSYTFFHGSLSLIPGELWRFRVKKIDVDDNTLILYVY